MKKWICLILILAFAAIAHADSYEAVTIADTAGGTGLTAATYGRARSALCRLETAPIRYTTDGATAPTTSVGIIVNPMEWIILGSPGEIKNFKGIRTGDTSGSLKCFYFE